MIDIVNNERNKASVIAAKFKNSPKIPDSLTFVGFP